MTSIPTTQTLDESLAKIRKPKKPAGLIYAIEDIALNEVVYIGKTTTSLKSRLLQHLNDRDSKIGQFIKSIKDHDRYLVTWFYLEDLDTLNYSERILIKEYNPELNTVHKTGKKTKDGLIDPEFLWEKNSIIYLKCKSNSIKKVLPRRKRINQDRKHQVIRRVFRLLSLNPNDVTTENWDWVKQEIKNIAKELDRVRM